MSRFTESVVEDAAVEWLEGIDYTIAHGPDIAPDGSSPERSSYADVVLIERLRLALANINPTVPPKAIDILLNRPQDWSTDALGELRQKLAAARERFTLENLQKAHAARYHKALVDIISMVKHAADEQQPLLTAEERVDRAITETAAGQEFTAEQEAWLDRIRSHLIENLSIDREDFENLPVLARDGGWSRANQAFDGQLSQLLSKVNESIAA